MKFKVAAKQHQLKYFKSTENQSKIPASKREGRGQAHWLNKKSAGAGRNFYKDYDIFQKVKESRGNKPNIPEWFYDTLRSQHIPFNLFLPFIKEQELAVKVWNDLLQLDITSIDQIEFEYPSTKENPLGDRTSFDTFFRYTNTRNQQGILGVEVKYTEGGYSPTDAEKTLINEPESVYYNTTRKSKLYNLKACNIDDVENNFLRKNLYRQIWRNHLLAYAYEKANYKIKKFTSITLYHEGNTHFTKAFEKYRDFLTPTGKQTLVEITYADFCRALKNHVKPGKQTKWMNYLIERYNITVI